MRKEIEDDLYRIVGKNDIKLLRHCIKYNEGFRFLYLWRKAKSSNGILKKIYTRLLWRLECRTGIEIPLTAEIGSGLQFIHPHNITVNGNVKIGKNCVLLKGSTIGNQKRGEKKGAPVIGNDFYLGLNATVVGGIHIGDDVLIAANAFVNFDVPSHSVVVGNPGVIHAKKNATEGYINNRISE